VECRTGEIAALRSASFAMTRLRVGTGDPYRFGQVPGSETPAQLEITVLSVRGMGVSPMRTQPVQIATTDHITHAPIYHATKREYPPGHGHPSIHSLRKHLHTSVKSAARPIPSDPCQSVVEKSPLPQSCTLLVPSHGNRTILAAPSGYLVYSHVRSGAI